MAGIGTNLISSLNKIANSYVEKPASGENSGGQDFKEILNKAIERFESVGDDNAQSTLDLLTGNADDLSNTMISAQKSEIAVNLVVAVRNKAVEAYKEIMNMQV